MKKNKLIFGLVTGLLSIGALTACNEVTAAEGVVLTYTDANGNVTQYTAAELFDSYQVGTSVANTDFQKIKEVLIRKYYESGSGKSSLESLKKKATNDIDGYRKEAKKNAETNGTDYGTEWEKILKAQGAENYDELYDKLLFKQEEADFKLHGYYGTTAAVRNQSRDGKKYATVNGNIQYDERGNAVLTEEDFFPESEDFGRAKKGYLEEKMPYHVSHILVGVSGVSETNATTGTINAEESKKLGELIINLATKDESEGGTKPVYLTTFNKEAKQSADTGSGEKYGDLGIMDFDTSFVQGFQYGLYAYDAHFNTEENAFATTKGLRANLLPSQTDDVTYYDKDGSRRPLKTAFAAGGILDEIGEIPYGVAVALANEDVYSNFPTLNHKVNGGSETYFPRNILFNKYFNTHKIAVITPEDIPFNTWLRKTGEEYLAADSTAAKSAILTDSEDFSTEAAHKGVAQSDAYLALPGFSRKVQIDGEWKNVLTTEKGQVVLAVRGDSGEKGIHFIVIDRSPLSGYGTEINADQQVRQITEAEYLEKANTADVTNLSEYYSMLNPVADKPSESYANMDAVVAAKQKGNKFPFYVNNAENSLSVTRKTTFVYNRIDSNDKTTYTSSISSIEDKASSYNSALLDGYTFQKLFEDGSITFNESNPYAKKVADLIKSHSKVQRESSYEAAIDNKDDAWTKYIEFLIQEQASRTYREKGDQKLISETCAIGYLSNDANPDNKQGIWAIGGACYAK